MRTLPASVALVAVLLSAGCHKTFTASAGVTMDWEDICGKVRSCGAAGTTFYPYIDEDSAAPRVTNPGNFVGTKFNKKKAFAQPVRCGGATPAENWETPHVSEVKIVFDGDHKTKISASLGAELAEGFKAKNVELTAEAKAGIERAVGRLVQSTQTAKVIVYELTPDGFDAQKKACYPTGATDVVVRSMATLELSAKQTATITEALKAELKAEASVGAAIAKANIDVGLSIDEVSTRTVDTILPATTYVLAVGWDD